MLCFKMLKPLIFSLPDLALCVTRMPELHSLKLCQSNLLNTLCKLNTVTPSNSMTLLKRSFSGLFFRLNWLRMTQLLQAQHRALSSAIQKHGWKHNHGAQKLQTEQDKLRERERASWNESTEWSVHAFFWAGSTNKPNRTPSIPLGCFCRKSWE